MSDRTRPGDMLREGRSAAWDALHDPTRRGWYVGRPSYHGERRKWASLRLQPLREAGHRLRRRKWMAIAESDEAVVREMAGCLREIGRRNVPK